MIEEQFAAELKFALMAAGRSQRWLAAQLDVTEATVSMWAQAHRAPTLPTIEKIGEVLGVVFEVKVSGLMVGGRD